MSTINLPKVRACSDITFRVSLKDNDVAIDWTSLSDVKALIYHDAQKAVAGRCVVAVDEEDSTVLVCTYAATKPQYLGINSIVIRCKYMGREKTYDKPAVDIVARTAEATGQTQISDPEVDVDIDVEEVSTSLLDNAIAAAFDAAADAEEAAHLVPLQVLQDCVEATGEALAAAGRAPYIGENGHWWVWSPDDEAYVDTDTNAQGPTGNGISSWTVVESAEDAGNNVVTVTFTNGDSESFTVKNGHTGNGIASIVQTVESPDDAGTNVITITMTNGNVVTFNVKNGSKGQPGAAQAAYKSVNSLPTASAATMDKIYLTPSGTSGVYNMSYTDYDGSAYSWVDLGTTAIQLSDYATKAEVSQLEAETTDKIGGEYTPTLNLEQGGIASATGLDTTSTTRIRTGNYILADTIKVTTSGSKVYVIGYKSDGTFVSASGWITTTQDVTIVGADKYRLVFAFSNDATITPSDFSSLNVSIVAASDGVFADKDTVNDLSNKLIKLVGYGATGTAAGAINVGDVFYNTSTKLLRRKTDSSWETINYEDGAIYTMGGRLWVWNGSDLVELPTPNYVELENTQRDNAIKSSVKIGDLLYGLIPKVGYYIDESGVEIASAGTEYFVINLPAQYGYIFFRPLESGFASITYFLVYADENGVLGHNGTGGNKGIQSTSAVNEWVCEALPSGTTKIYASFVPGKERKVQMASIFPIYENNAKAEFTNAEIFVNDTTMNLRTYFTNGGALNRSNALRSTVPIKVNVGDVIRVSGYSTESTPPSSTNYKLNTFNANMQYIGVSDFETDPYDYTVPSGVSFVSFLIITAALPTVSIKRVAVGASSPKILADAVQGNSMWDGKIWAGLGDSLTAQSSSYPGLLWSPMVEDATGLVFKNCGIGSTCLAGNGANAFWKRLSAVEGYNPDIVTILGGANDLYEDIPIGNDSEMDAALADKDCTTFIGAYSYIVETLLTWKKTVRLVLLTTSYAHTNGADHTPGIGLTYKDYANATLRVAEYYGLPVVDLYRNMGLNKLTQDSTLTRGDHIHWNARASQIVASLVIAKLEEINNAVPTE